MSRLINKLREIYLQQEKPLILQHTHWYQSDDLHQDIVIVQHFMSQSHIRTGDRILLSLPNSYEFIVIYLAIIDFGAVAVTINPQMPDAEFQSFVQRCRPISAFVGQNHADVLKKLWNNLSDMDSFFLCSGSPDEIIECTATHSIAESEKHGVPVLVPVNNNPQESDIAVLLYTSGTTGQPKPVGLSHEQIYCAVQNIIQAHRLSACDRAFSILPLFHINAQVVSVLSALLSRGTLVVASKFSASCFWATVNDKEVTWVSAVPAIISILMSIDAPTVLPKKLRFIRSASAPLSAHQSIAFEKRLGIPLIQSYGMTEAASQICTNPLPPQIRKPGSVGLPVGLELQIFDAVDRPLPRECSGEIVIRGKNVITHYQENAGMDDFGQGWFHTGDIGYQDPDGYVFIIGRKKELINRGGEKISPYAIEAVINQVEGVHQAAVIGLPDQKYGEIVAAYIVAEDSSKQSRDEIMHRVNHRCKVLLSDYKCPEVVRFVNHLPVGATGKIKRRMLKQFICSLKTFSQRSIDENFSAKGVQ